MTNGTPVLIDVIRGCRVPQGQVGAGECGEMMDTGFSRFNGVGASDSSPMSMPAWTTMFTLLDVPQTYCFILDTGSPLTYFSPVVSIFLATDKSYTGWDCPRMRAVSAGGAPRPCAVACIGGSVGSTAQPVPQRGFLHEQAFTAWRFILPEPPLARRR